MKKTMYVIAFVFLASTGAFAADVIGKVSSIIGDVDLTAITTGNKIVPRVGTPLTDDHKIRTGNRSYCELLLNDGTKIFVREITVLNITGLKLVETDPPTKMRVLTGKVRITMKKAFKSRTLVLRTPTAIAGVRGTDFGAIVSKTETRLIVFEGAVDVANTDREILKSYIVKEKEEVSVKKDAPPTVPRIVPRDVIENWFDYYEIDGKNRIIIKSRKEEGIIDTILRKKDF